MTNFDNAIVKFTNGFRSFEIAARMEDAGFAAVEELRKNFKSETAFGHGDNIDTCFLVYFAAAILVERAKDTLAIHILPEQANMIQELAKKSVSDLGKITDIRDHVRPYQNPRKFANGAPKPYTAEEAEAARAKARGGEIEA